MKTLYVTDLDGTLLTPDAEVSEYSKRVLAKMSARGELTTFATARSLETAEIVTRGTSFSAPRIIYNGAFVRGEDGRDVAANVLGNAAYDVLNDMLGGGLSLIVYSLRRGEEKFTYIPDRLTAGEQWFISTRKNCKRNNPVKNTSELYDGEIFYIVCIDDEKRLLPYYEKYKSKFNCVLSVDPYMGNTWLEIMHKNATKANGIKLLKKLYECRAVVFGDGKNDIDMFLAADEGYAVENAVDALKSVATGIIGGNRQDGVAKWLEKNVLGD